MKMALKSEDVAALGDMVEKTSLTEVIEALSRIAEEYGAILDDACPATPASAARDDYRRAAKDLRSLSYEHI